MLKLTDITEPEVEKISILDALFWIDRDRSRLIPVVRGGDGPDDDQPDPDDDQPADKTFTQAEVNRLLGRTRSEAAKAAKKEVEDYLASQKSDADKATMDEAARAKAEADEARHAAETARSEAARERFAAKVERKLATAGVGKGIDDDSKAAAALARAVRLIDLEPDATDEEIAAEIDALKDDMPGLFATTVGNDDDGKKKPTSGVTTGSGAGKGSGNGAGTKTAMERGRELYLAKKQKTTTAA